MDVNPLAHDQVGTLVRERREAVQMSLRALAKASGFSASFISQVEHGQASPSIASLGKIASVLGVTLSEFFAIGADVQASPIVIRASERPELSSGWSRATVEILAPARTGNQIDPMLISIAPGGRSSTQPTSHRAEEFVFVVAGRITLTLADGDHEMGYGDAVTLPANTSYQWSNATEERAQLLIVSAKPRD